MIDGVTSEGATQGEREEIQSALDDAYAVERELAVGGRVHLFLATDKALGRRVVLKVMPPELSVTLDATRFRCEILLAARLMHPNIVPVLSAGEARGFLYYTMPFVEGDSLHARIVRDGKLPITDVVSILRDLAKALAYAHAHGVVHRDVKPDNVLLEQGTALLTDFGIAKALTAAARDDGGLTCTDGRPATSSPAPVVGPRWEEVGAAGIAVGTPMYVSPEQASGDPRIDHRTDLYSLGVVAYEMLAGHPPFTYDSLRAILAAHRSEPPPPITSFREDTPPVIAQLVMRLLAKRPADRPQSADEVVRILDGAMAVSPSAMAQVGRALSARVPTSLAARVSRAGLAALATVLLVTTLFVSAVGANRWWRRAPTSVRRVAAAAIFGTAARNAANNAVVVLRFSTVGRDSVEQLFDDGLTDELSSALGAVPGVRVTSRTSVAELQEKDLTAVAIADSMHARRVLEGTVERSGDRFRVTAQLVSARNGLAFWSGTYESSARDPFAAQDEITKQIVSALASRGIATRK
jgi:serine/threonine-protein kinase